MPWRHFALFNIEGTKSGFNAKNSQDIPLSSEWRHRFILIRFHSVFERPLPRAISNGCVSMKTISVLCEQISIAAPFLAYQTTYLFHFHFVVLHKWRKKLLEPSGNTRDMLIFSYIFSTAFFWAIKALGSFSRYLLGKCQECILSYYMEESVLLGTKPLVESIRHFIRDPSGVFSVCHLCECRVVQWRHDSRLLLLLNWFLHIIKRTLHVGSKIWILCSRGKNSISLVRFAHSWDIVLATRT